MCDSQGILLEEGHQIRNQPAPRGATSTEEPFSEHLKVNYFNTPLSELQATRQFHVCVCGPLPAPVSG